jgi:hypothetical protein
MNSLYDDRRPTWYDDRRTSEQEDLHMHPTATATPAPANPPTAAPREQWSDARLSAVVEAAYLLEAVRR